MSSGFGGEFFGRPSLAIVAGPLKKNIRKHFQGRKCSRFRRQFIRHLHLLARVLLQQSPPGGVQDHLQRIFFLGIRLMIYDDKW